MQLSFTLPHLPVRSMRAMLVVFVLFYLGFHAISGERGILAWFKANHKLTVLEQELAEVKTKRETMQKRVDLLSGPEIDYDMLDEQARRVLGFAGQNEVVILNKDPNP